MIFFLLCAYNEARNIVEVINKIRNIFYHYNYQIVVVNDGSTDETLQVLEEVKNSDLTIISHSQNLGLGAAMRTGLDYIMKVINFKNDVVVTMDADNTHPVEITKFMLEKFSSGAHLVIASRYCPGGKQYGVEFYRKLLSFVARVVLSILFPYHNLRDYTSGYRMYSGEILKLLMLRYGKNFITQKTFAVQLELLIKLLRFKPNLYEVPLNLEYYKKYGKSKLKIIKNVLAYIILIFQLKLSS
ncbi:MAG: glycosyltransferase family 2 protein [Elusimicrobiota bacterium]|nr:glycosyltransferase family 2 protein [Endomicrobiia bacterium]MDW8055982.1 glycosyltransferase family 2 protein [Elusimicrobiota bacterium]